MLRRIAIVLVFILIPITTATAEPRFAIQAQAQFVPHGYVTGGLFETQLDALPSGLSLAARYSYLEYYYEDGDYWEEGWGPMYGVGVKYYTGGTPMQGWYVGGEVLLFDVTVYWRDYSSYGNVWIEGVVPTFSAGYHKSFGTFFIEPQALLAVSAIAASDSDAPPVVITIGLGAGYEF